MLLPRFAGLVSVWSDTFLRPLLRTNDSAAKTNGASAVTNGSSAATNGTAATTNGSGAKPAQDLRPLPLVGLPAHAGGIAGQARDYWLDRAQRTVLLLDVMRRRGNTAL